MQASIQRATQQDVAKLIPLMRDYHAFEGIRLTDEERQQALNLLLTNPSLGGAWLVIHAQQVVGYIVLCTGFSIEFVGFDAFIDEFYIGPEFRGKGLGHLVLDQIKDEASAINVRAVHLEVALGNKRAQNLYSQAGFKARDRYQLMSIDIQSSETCGDDKAKDRSK